MNREYIKYCHGYVDMEGSLFPNPYTGFYGHPYHFKSKIAEVVEAYNNTFTKQPDYFDRFTIKYWWRNISNAFKAETNAYSDWFDSNSRVIRITQNAGKSGYTRCVNIPNQLKPLIIEEVTYPQSKRPKMVKQKSGYGIDLDDPIYGNDFFKMVDPLPFYPEFKTIEAEMPERARPMVMSKWSEGIFPERFTYTPKPTSFLTDTLLKQTQKAFAISALTEMTMTDMHDTGLGAFLELYKKYIIESTPVPEIYEDSLALPATQFATKDKANSLSLSSAQRLLLNNSTYGTKSTDYNKALYYTYKASMEQPIPSITQELLKRATDK
jgi:hypothetical protein